MGGCWKHCLQKAPRKINAREVHQGLLNTVTPVFGSRSFQGISNLLEDSVCGGAGGELTATLAPPSALWITRLLVLVSASVIPLIFIVMSLETNKIHITRWFYSQVACNFLELRPSSCWLNIACMLQCADVVLCLSYCPFTAYSQRVCLASVH